jgi:glucan-binding YG repeat protein
MITITFTPETTAQANVVAQAMSRYLEVSIDSTPAPVADTALTAQQQADLAAAEANRADDAARETMQAKRDAAKKPKAAKAAPTEAAPAPSEPSPSPSTPAADAPAAEVTLEQVRAKLATLSQAGKAAQVKGLIAQFGVAKLTDVPTEKYSQLLQEAEALA